MYWNSETIKAARETRCIDQKKLAKQLGCTVSTVKAWEDGEYLPKKAYSVLLSMYFSRAPLFKSTEKIKKDLVQ